MREKRLRRTARARAQELEQVERRVNVCAAGGRRRRPPAQRRSASRPPPCARAPHSSRTTGPTAPRSSRLIERLEQRLRTADDGARLGDQRRPMRCGTGADAVAALIAVTAAVADTGVTADRVAPALPECRGRRRAARRRPAPRLSATCGRRLRGAPLDRLHGGDARRADHVVPGDQPGIDLLEAARPALLVVEDRRIRLRGARKVVRRLRVGPRLGRS